MRSSDKNGRSTRSVGYVLRKFLVYNNLDILVHPSIMIIVDRYSLSQDQDYKIKFAEYTNRIKKK